MEEGGKLMEGGGEADGGRGRLRQSTCPLCSQQSALPAATAAHHNTHASSTSTGILNEYSNVGMGACRHTL